MINFDFFTSTRIVFGWGQLNELGNLMAPLGTRAFVVTGKTTQRAGELFQLLGDAGIHYESCAVGNEPSMRDVEDALVKARDFGCDMIIGFGGGSVLDTGKALAALLANPGGILDYLEVVGKGNPLKLPSVPYIAIPTTSGTGTEVTRNAVLGVPEQGVKVSMRSSFMLPRIALVDPQLTVSVPPHITASTGLDALTQLMEAYVSVKANPMVDLFCREGMHRISRSLWKAYTNGSDRIARTDMSFSALLSGLALANAGLGAVHGFAGPLGGMISAPHGIICASLLPWVMEQNIRILEETDDKSNYLSRYDEIARILTGDSYAGGMDGVVWVRELCRKLEIPSLQNIGFERNLIPELIQKSANSSSMKGNPVVLSSKQMEEILQNAL